MYEIRNDEDRDHSQQNNGDGCSTGEVVTPESSIPHVECRHITGEADPGASHGYDEVIYLERDVAQDDDCTEGDGLQKRDFVHVSDVVKAIWLALTKSGAEGVFNIASGKPVSIRKLAKAMSKLVDIEKPQIIHEKLRKGDIRQSHGDYSKAKKILGFTPETELEDGLGGLLDSAYVIVDSVIKEAPVL